ncbi:MAG: DNA-binding protein WhiA [Clostridiales Family XIII bacterium]|jgi:DNA-binding protein WhiA|nr:DNA-binding protein WhiA [Clostridiales Family XIII bacterium]
MSFSLETKNELARIKPEKKCCQLAEIAGFIRMGGTVRLSGGGKLTLILSTENPAVARHYKTLLKEYFGASANLLVGHANFQKKGHLYELCLDEGMDAEQMLRETGILLVREGCNYIGDGIYEELLKTKCCRKSYLRGVFLGAGTLNDPEKGYHLEIVCSTEALAADVKKLFNGFVDIHAKTCKRKNHFVVYLKGSEQITDILNILGAHGQLLKFENVRIVKGIRNQTNRISNCDNANLDKALRAAEKQIADIRKIIGGRGMESLPEKLRKVAAVRLEHPDVSLSELGEMMKPPLNKSGVYRRLKKIEETADKL